MSKLDLDVASVKEIYEELLSPFNARLFISQQPSGSVETVIFKDIDSFISEKKLDVQAFKDIEEYKKVYAPSSSSLLSLERFFDANKGKELFCINGSFSFDKEALAINQGHKGLDLLVVNLNNKEEIYKILSLPKDDINYSKKELLCAGILEVDNKLMGEFKKGYLDSIVEQYEDSSQNENRLSYVLYNDLNISIYWETLTKEIFDEKLYSDEWLIMKDNNHIIDITLDYDGGFHYKLYPKDTPISDYEEIEKDYKESFLAKGYIEPVFSEEYGHNVADEKCFEKILEASENFSLNQNNQSDSNESKKVRRDR